ncbi:MAG: hypothetical protein WBP45_04980 [Daejeonella sp.]
MKIMKLLLITILIVAAFTGCKKDTTVRTPKVSIEGRWTGVFKDTLQKTENTMHLYIETDHTVTLMNDFHEEFITGTWSVTTTNIFTATFDSEGANIKAIFDGAEGKLRDGTFGNKVLPGNPFSNVGTWSMTKDKDQ